MNLSNLMKNLDPAEKEGKIRRLNENAIPSKFPGVPAYLSK